MFLCSLFPFILLGLKVTNLYRLLDLFIFEYQSKRKLLFSFSINKNKTHKTKNNCINFSFEKLTDEIKKLGNKIIFL